MMMRNKGLQTKICLRLFLASLITIVIGLAIMQSTAHGAAQTNENDEEKPPIEVYLDTNPLQFPIDPILQDGTTQVPFRVLFEAMGMEVGWDDTKRLVTGKRDGLTIELTIGNKEAYVNGEMVSLLQPPRIVSGHTLVPLRFVGESTGAVVAWDAKHRQITILTEKFAEQVGMTMDEMREFVAQLEKENSLGGGSDTPPPSTLPPPMPPEKLPQRPSGDGSYKPAAGTAVSLSSLQGMYYGHRGDLGGYECGGICWDIYTFLPDKKILIGQPPMGGPETINCKRDGCLTYTISNGVLTLSDGKKLAISVEDGTLIIEDVPLIPAQPAADDLRLNHTYVNIRYWGLIGITGYASSSTEYITFYSNGTFETDSTTLGSLDTGATVTNGVATDGSSGTYLIRGNTITLAYNDGRTEHKLFFVQDAPDNLDIQIGELNYYVDKEE